MISFMLAVLATAVPSENPDKATSSNVTPILTLRGGQCSIKSAAAYLVTSASDFEKVNKKLEMKINEMDSAFEVDYTKYVVVILCSGEWPCLDYTTHTIIESDGTIKIRYQNRMTGIALSEPVKYYAPFSLIVLERSQKKLVIEQNTQFDSDKPPKWVQRAVFDKIVEKN